MRSSTALAILSLIPSLVTSAPIRLTKRARFAFGSEKVRGVNLGGWFVLEPWITPSLFDAAPTTAVDEFTYTAALGATEAQNRLQRHWDSFITREDFVAIKNAGMNHVRIPIGYWSITPIQGEPFVQGAYEGLKKAVGWAGEVGLGVVIDLHGGPGSQNGFDNSGKYGSIAWGQGDSVAQTLSALTKIRDDFASNPAVTTIELLNEPGNWGIDINIIRKFYTDGYNLLKDSGVAVMIHDAFLPLSAWNDFGVGWPNLILDTHHYEVFDAGQLRMNTDAHVGSGCAYGGAMAATNKVTISGEWTGAMTDCAKWLNGRAKGTRYEATFQGQGADGQYVGSCAGKSEGPVSGLNTVDTARFIEAQLDGYEKAGGWIFWTWKTEGAPEWDMKALMAQGVFPSPVTARKYPGQCG